MLIDVTPAELDLVLEALDSHRYWQVSEESQRDSGFVHADEDDENAEELAEIDGLEEKLRAQRDKEPACAVSSPS